MPGNRSDRKLTWEERCAVYDSRRGGPDPYIPGTVWAARLGVSTTTITHIRQGKIYKGLPGEPLVPNSPSKMHSAEQAVRHHKQRLQHLGLPPTRGILRDGRGGKHNG